MKKDLWTKHAPSLAINPNVTAKRVVVDQNATNAHRDSTNTPSVSSVYAMKPAQSANHAIHKQENATARIISLAINAPSAAPICIIIRYASRALVTQTALNQTSLAAIRIYASQTELYVRAKISFTAANARSAKIATMASAPTRKEAVHRANATETAL